jgi:hypothetical protein
MYPSSSCNELCNNLVVLPIKSLESHFENISAFNIKVTEINKKHLETPENIKKIFDLLEEAKIKLTELIGERFHLERQMSKFYVQVLVNELFPSPELNDYADDNYILNARMLMWRGIKTIDKFLVEDMYKWLIETKSSINRILNENWYLESKLNGEIRHTQHINGLIDSV